MTERVSTGIDVLDRHLNGGIPRGRVAMLSAPPTSQSELFLYELASVQRMVYLTTERSKRTVRDVLERTGAASDDVEVHRVDDADPLADAERSIRDLPDRSTVVIDPIRLLEQQPESEYRSFLNELKTATTEADGVAFLHCLDGRGVSDKRDLTEYVTDIILDLSTELRGDTIENRLTVPKFRGGQALEEAIQLNLTTDVSIDISRKIA